MAKLRHLARVVSLQALVALTMRENNDPEKVFEYIKNEFAPELHNDELANNIYFGVIKNRQILDEKIQEFAPRWPINKLAAIERCVLEIGAYELMFAKDTPYAVILDEAIELAKEFGDGTAGSFINGVLSSIAKAVRSLDIK